MKNIRNYSENQKKGLYEMLKASKNMTPAEKGTYKKLREYFAEMLEVGCYKLLYLDGYVKEIEMDTFGEDYRFGWIKVRYSSKGEYYLSSYYGKRIYLN